jgi:hypothetical protein
LSRRAIEVPGELDLLVTDRRDASERARHVGFHEIANRVELQSDFLESASLKKDCRGGFGVGCNRSKGGGAERSEKAAS